MMMTMMMIMIMVMIVRSVIWCILKTLLGSDFLSNRSWGKTQHSWIVGDHYDGNI